MKSSEFLAIAIKFHALFCFCFLLVFLFVCHKFKTLVFYVKVYKKWS